MVLRKINLLITSVLLFTGSIQLLDAQVSYEPGISIRSKIQKNIWQDLKPKTPKNLRFLVGMTISSGEAFKYFEQVSKRYQWNPNELVTVSSFFEILSNEVVRGKDYSEAEIKHTYSEITSHYKAGNVDQSLDNSSKQEKYDPLIIKAYWLGAMMKLAKNNKQLVRELAQETLKMHSYKATTNSAVTETRRSVLENVNPHNTPVKTPSKSLPNSRKDIEDIILRTVTSYGLNGVYIRNDVSVLFKNGDLFTNPSKPLASLDIDASKRKNPKKWDRWKKKGTIIYVTRSKNGKTYDWKKWFKLRSANKGFKLSGKFNSSDPFGGSAVINASIVVFDAQGRFAWKTIKGGDTSWKPIYSKSNSAGTYIIENHTMTLRYNNGTTESFFFGLYPKDDQHFVVGSSHFVPVKN